MANDDDERPPLNPRTMRLPGDTSRPRGAMCQVEPITRMAPTGLVEPIALVERTIQPTGRAAGNSPGEENLRPKNSLKRPISRRTKASYGRSFHRAAEVRVQHDPARSRRETARQHAKIAASYGSLWVPIILGAGLPA